jgi:hypothetical protein
MSRAETLFKLLRLGPATLERLIRITGWSYEHTQHALLILIADGRVLYRYVRGRKCFRLKRLVDSRPRNSGLRHSYTGRVNLLR